MQKHCISYPPNKLVSVNHYCSFRIKQELLVVYSYRYKFICVYIVSFQANIHFYRIREEGGSGRRAQGAPPPPFICESMT